MPSPADLARAFAERGTALPPAIECHDTIGSTNDRLKELAREDAPESTADEPASG